MEQKKVSKKHQKKRRVTSSLNEEMKRNEKKERQLSETVPATPTQFFNAEDKSPSGDKIKLQEEAVRFASI